MNTKSNHPPHKINRIPSMILDRISNISNSENVFKRAAPVYNDALKASEKKDKTKKH